MYNLIFPTSAERPKNWTLWIHGGPFEQVSKRFNPYFDALSKAGHGIIVVNYPGSLGIGNPYELRDIEEEQLLKTQSEYIENDVRNIFEQRGIGAAISVVGVSYGSKIANNLIKRKKLNINKLVDFSGIYEDDHNFKIPTIYLFGKYDYALKKESRVDLIRSALDSATKVRIFPTRDT